MSHWPGRTQGGDDNKDSADSLGMLLRLKANEIRTAYDGMEAVKVAEAFRPELVLLDIGLPKLNGYDVARRIRQQPWGRDVILVALTGWGQDEDRRRSQEAGFNFHIVKPLELAALEKLLAESGKESGTPRATSQALGPPEHSGARPTGTEAADESAQST